MNIIIIIIIIVDIKKKLFKEEFAIKQTMTRLAIIVLTTCVVVSFGSAGPILKKRQAEGAAAPAGAAAATPTANAGADTSKSTPDNGNVYGNVNNNNNLQNNLQNDQPKQNQRGYNQGYSYNTGIKPYTRGYTYYQPFGDAVQEHPNDQQNNAQQPQATPQTSSAPTAGAAAPGKAPAMPVDFGSFFGPNTKMGPVKVIPNQNVPVDENGIPNLDVLEMPNISQTPGQAGNAALPAAKAAAPIRPPVAMPQIPVNPNEFNMGNDFNLAGLVPDLAPTTTRAPSIFDFAPPSNNNFDFDQPGGIGGGGDQTDYNNLDNFGGNLNNFNNYLGETPMSSNADGFNFGGQQVPSEVVNLNNAFGSGPASGGSGGGGGGGNANIPLPGVANVQAAPGGQEMSDLFNSFGDAGGGGNRASNNNAGNTQPDIPVDLGSFSSPSNNRQKQPNNFFNTFL